MEAVVSLGSDAGQAVVSHRADTWFLEQLPGLCERIAKYGICLSTHYTLPNSNGYALQRIDVDRRRLPEAISGMILLKLQELILSDRTNDKEITPFSTPNRAKGAPAKITRAVTVSAPHTKVSRMLRMPKD